MVVRSLLDLGPAATGAAAAPAAAAPEAEDYWPTSVGALIVAGLCAFTAAAISIYQIVQHALNYEDAIIQRYFIRIIFLIPNYALCSFFILVFQDAALYIESVRDIYEAFVIYSFLSLLLEYIGGPGTVEAFCRDRVVQGSCLYGTCCFPPMQVDGQFVKLCKRLVLQFVILKPILATLTIVLYTQGHYTVDDWSLSQSYAYLQIVYNFTYAAALLGLIHFWAGTKELLKPYKPVWKFLTVKAVVFITFWQGLVISLALINQPDQNARQLQTWLLCLEMLPAAAAMYYAFPFSPYMHNAQNRAQGGIMMAVQNVGNVVTFTDVVTDLKHQFVPQYNTYTCYKDMDAEDESAAPAPSGQYRHATYVIRDPFQEQAIASQRSSQRQSSQGQVASTTNGAGPSRAGGATVQDLSEGFEVDGGAQGVNGHVPTKSVHPSGNPFMQDL